MKKKLSISWRHALAGIALASSVGWTNPAQGQSFIPASTPETFLALGRADRTRNTGCGQSNDGRRQLQVLTWDGTTPSFGWDYNGTTGFQPLEGTRRRLDVYDPDIVAYYDVVKKEHHMVAVYLIYASTGVPGVAYEEQVYDPGTNSWTVATAPTRIDNGRGGGLSPNIDVTHSSGDAVMVYSDGRTVYSRALNIPSSTLYGLQIVDNTNTPANQHREPDVAIYEDASGQVPAIVSVTYITVDAANGTLEVDLTQDKLTTIQNNPFPPSSPSFGPVSDRFTLATPRIAAPMHPIGYGTVDLFDCMSAVRFDDGTGDQILSLTRQAGSGIMVNVVNAPLTSGYSFTNATPVVTYLGDGALVAWNYYDIAIGAINQDLDILGAWVDLMGAPLSPPHDLLIANYYTKGNQLAPSIEGRNGLLVPTNPLSNNGVATWFYEPDNGIAYKPLHGFSPQLRASQVTPKAERVTLEKQLAVYPNPATASSRVALSLAPGEAAQVLQVLDPRTGAVVATLPAAALSTGPNEIALPKLPAGLYVLRLQTSSGPRITRFDYQP